MTGFLYYTHGGQPITPARARELGLAYALDKHLGSAGVKTGPDGLGGQIFADSERVPAHKRKYVESEQTWRKIPRGERTDHESPDVWVGLWNAPADRPGPDDLRRADALKGHLVKLADERDWLVPVARVAAADEAEQLQFYIALPTISTLGDDGRWQPGAIAARYAPLWDVAQRFAAAISLAGASGGDEGRYVLEFDNLHAAACLALQTNYRVGPAEIALLQLLTEQHCVKVLQALIDWPTLAHWLSKKKRVGGGSSVNNGDED